MRPIMSAGLALAMLTGVGLSACTEEGADDSMTAPPAATEPAPLPTPDPAAPATNEPPPSTETPAQ
jgi:hypothetical protein